MMRAAVSPQDLPYYLLRQLEDEPVASQRVLAGQLSLSLGGINCCLHALVDKGMIMVNNFRRSHDELGHAFVLTPEEAQ